MLLSVAREVKGQYVTSIDYQEVVKKRFYIGNDTETSGLLLDSVFCNMQRTSLFEYKDTIFFQISHSLQEENHVN